MIRTGKKDIRLELPCPGGMALVTRRGGEITVRLAYQGASGTGERFDSLTRKGRHVITRVEEKFCFQGEKTYCPAPFFWTDTGFGLYADTCRVTEFDFREEEILIKLPEESDAVLFSGTPEEIVREYMALSGQAVLPPEWIFTPWISANRWHTQAEAEEQIRLLEKHGYHAGVIVLEAWSDEATFYIFNGAKYTPVKGGAALKSEDFDFSGSPWPDPAGMIKKLHAAGLHLLLWQVPVYKKQDQNEVPNAQNDLDRADALQRGLCVMKKDGTPYTIPEGHWFSGSLLPDFTNPETVKAWFDKRQYLLELGVDGFKTDGGEFILSEDACFSDGSTGREGINRYARDYEESYSRFAGKGRVIFSRAGYTGQHTVPAHWAGDQQSVNEEMKAVLRAGLSAAASGMIFWGFDMAGFAGPLPTPDLYRRATQAACFTPIMQWHSEPDGGQFRELMPGGTGNNERSPWNMAEAYAMPGFIEEMRYWNELRMQLQPYLRATAEECVKTSRPMLRPLVYVWPEDANTLNCEDEFMLGDALLVAPLTEENAQAREVYLPQGKWKGFFDGQEYTGGKTVTAGGEGKLPVFIREGYPVATLLQM